MGISRRVTVRIRLARKENRCAMLNEVQFFIYYIYLNSIRVKYQRKSKTTMYNKYSYTQEKCIYSIM